MLDQIIGHKREEIAEAEAAMPLTELRRLAAWQPQANDFAAALRPVKARPGRTPALIAEVKRASPSRGVMNTDIDPAALAHDYAHAGAAAISVLTDRKFFRGSLEDLEAVRHAVAQPVLQKDFLINEYGVVQARAAGADAVLLIVAALDNAELRDLLAVTHGLGMNAIIEVHNEPELERAMQLDTRIIGVNNRNLATFEVDTNTTARLRPLVPPTLIFVAESGIRTAADVQALREINADAMLVGEALVTSGDVMAKIKGLLYS
ncbi:MAG: indole-3-glycerol phosphate synthase TrpC [Candidatus Chloroheliales bacterium]|nr:MAG: indole-3-glycerol phosphate synthase TrpC [Chloroflexota bacterium]